MQILKQKITKLGNEIKLISTNLSTVQPFNHSTALVIGVFHGDEPQGKFLIEEYLKRENPLSLTLPLEGGREHKPCQYSQFALIKAKELRKNCTDVEKIMWELLRAKRFCDLKFKRQQPIGNYIVDFVCFEKKLIIELDGGQHNENQNKIKDDNRTKYLENLGYKVIRFWNNDVIENLEGCVEYIFNNLIDLNENCGTVPSPLRGGGLGRGGNICPLPLARERTNILFIPCLNPDGMALNRRTNANGVDLNRNFPTKNWGEDGSEAGLFQFNSQSFAPSPQPSSSRGEGVCHDNLSNYQSFNCGPSPQPSPQGGEGVCCDSHSTSQPVNLSTGEPPLPSPPPQGGREQASASATNPYFGGESAGSEIETQFVMEVINEYKPEKILTLHAPYKVVNYDGPAKDWAESVSKIINYPVEESIGYPTPGSFGTYAGVERNIPVITLELDEEIPPEQLIPPVFEIFDNL